MVWSWSSSSGAAGTWGQAQVAPSQERGLLGLIRATSGEKVPEPLIWSEWEIQQRVIGSHYRKCRCSKDSNTEAVAATSSCGCDAFTGYLCWMLDVATLLIFTLIRVWMELDKSCVNSNCVRAAELWSGCVFLCLCLWETSVWHFQE